MSQQIPTTAEIKDVIVSQLETKLSTTIPALPVKFFRVLAQVLAALIIVLYKYAGANFLNQFVQFASTQETIVNGRSLIPLVEWGRLVGVGDPTAATRAEATVQITVNVQSGTIPAHTLITKTDTGFNYLTLADVTLDAATKTVNIRAYSDQDGGGGRGTGGNVQVGDVLSFMSPVANVESDVAVTALVTTAADAESWDAYRLRVVDRFRSQPQGGAPADYEQWGEAVEGIINVYPYTGDPGHVSVYCEATVASSGSADGIPTGAQLTAVEDYINNDGSGLANRRPINAFVDVYAITRTSFEVEVVDLVVEDETTVRTKIEEAMDSYFASRAPYISGLTLGARKDRITNSAVAGAVEDVVTAYNGVFTSVITRVYGGDQFVIYSLGEGEKAKVPSVLYT